MKNKLGISKTRLTKLIAEISKKIGCSGYIKEYSWRPKNGDWNGYIQTYIEDAIEFFDTDQPILAVHYWHRPAPGKEPNRMYRVVNFGDIQEIIKNGYEVYSEGSEYLTQKFVRPKKEIEQLKKEK